MHPLYDCERRLLQRNVVGKTSYLGLAGVGPDAATLPLTHTDAGLFGYDRVVKPADVPNTSNTLLLMETQTGGPWTQGGHSAVRGIEPGLAVGPAAPFGSRHTEGGLFGTPGVNVGMADGSAIHQEHRSPIRARIAGPAAGREARLVIRTKQR